MAQVLDASVGIAWCVTTQATALTDAAFEAVAATGARVPSIFWFEVLYALNGLAQRQVVARADVDTFITKLAALTIVIDEARSSTDMATLNVMSRHHRVSIYDAAYLDLALRTGLPLATRDTRLARAAESAGVTLFKP